MANTIVKTPIVYYGGKTSILPYLLEMVPVHSVYTETFLGGGTLFWAKDPVKNETINDRMDLVVNFYRVLKREYRSLKKLIDASLISRTIHMEANQLIRAHKYGIKIDRVELAWAFWLASNFSHMHKLNGGYKQQKSGGKSIARELTNKKNEFTQHLVDRIENTVIENEHWLKVANARNDKDAFHYLDPSYPGTDQGSLHRFTWDDYHELLNWCAKECKGKFMLSNYNSPVLNQFIKYNGWTKREITHQLKRPRKNGTQTEKT